MRANKGGNDSPDSGEARRGEARQGEARRGEAPRLGRWLSGSPRLADLGAARFLFRLLGVGGGGMAGEDGAVTSHMKSQCPNCFEIVLKMSISKICIAHTTNYVVQVVGNLTLPFE